MSHENPDMPRSAGPAPAVGEGRSPLGNFLTEQEKQIDADYEWCLQDSQVRRQYGGRVVAVHQRRIWGVGGDHGAALEAALREPGCPPRQALVLAVVPDDLPDEPEQGT
jgi:hypothetical protein